MPNAEKQAKARIKLPIASTEVWERLNPVLLEGEAGFELTADGVFCKVGDGETAWGSLPYFSAQNAKEAVKLKTAKKIDGVDFDGSADISHYGVCNTEAATTEKTVACTGFSKTSGAWVVVTFAETNTADNPTLNVNGTGAAPIYYQGAAIPKSQLAPGRFRLFVYDGTYYEFVGDINTTHNAFTGATESANGKKGLVVAPAAGEQDAFLKGDGTWGYPEITSDTLIVSATEPENTEAVWFKVAADTQLSSSVKVSKIVVGATEPENPNAIWFKTAE